MENETRIGEEVIRAEMEKKGISRQAAIASVWPFLTEGFKETLRYDEIIAAYHEAAATSDIKDEIGERLKFPKAYNSLSYSF